MSQSNLGVLAIAGSLRRASFNRMALEVAKGLAPAGMSITIFEGLGDIPLYNEDLRGGDDPQAAVALADAVRAADAVLISTPEYNYSVPGVLKNALDWVSQAPDQPFKDKPVAIMGAALGALGTARAQYHLRQSFIFLDAHVLGRPEVFIGSARTKFDEAGALNDEVAIALITKQLEALKAWTLRLIPNLDDNDP